MARERRSTVAPYGLAYASGDGNGDESSHSRRRSPAASSRAFRDPFPLRPPGSSAADLLEQRSSHRRLEDIRPLRPPTLHRVAAARPPGVRRPPSAGGVPGRLPVERSPGPIRRAIGQQPGLAVDDHAPIHPDRVSHDRQTGRHVLQHLQSAFASAPGVVGQIADPDIRRGHIFCFSGGRPAPRDDGNTRKVGHSIADQVQFQSGGSLAGRLKMPGGQLQSLESARRADPDQPNARPGADMGGRAVGIGPDSGRHDADASGAIRLAWRPR